MRKLEVALAAVSLGLCLAFVGAHAADHVDIDVVLPLTGGGEFLDKAEQDALQEYAKFVCCIGRHSR